VTLLDLKDRSTSFRIQLFTSKGCIILSSLLLPSIFLIKKEKKKEKEKEKKKKIMLEKHINKHGKMLYALKSCT
jgi:hypothetical protein